MQIVKEALPEIAPARFDLSVAFKGSPVCTDLHREYECFDQLKARRNITAALR